jgi:hypothetical protein
MIYKISFPYDTELWFKVKGFAESILSIARVQCVKTKYCTYEFDSFAIATLRTLIELHGDCTIVIKKHGYIDKEYTCEDFIEYLRELNGEE